MFESKIYEMSSDEFKVSLIRHFKVFSWPLYWHNAELPPSDLYCGLLMNSSVHGEISVFATDGADNHWLEMLQWNLKFAIFGIENVKRIWYRALAEIRGKMSQICPP